MNFFEETIIFERIIIRRRWTSEPQRGDAQNFANNQAQNQRPYLENRNEIFQRGLIL